MTSKQYASSIVPFSSGGLVNLTAGSTVYLGCCEIKECDQQVIVPCCGSLLTDLCTEYCLGPEQVLAKDEKLVFTVRKSRRCCPKVKDTCLSCCMTCKKRCCCKKHLKGLKLRKGDKLSISVKLCSTRTTPLIVNLLASLCLKSEIESREKCESSSSSCSSSSSSSSSCKPCKPKKKCDSSPSSSSSSSSSSSCKPCQRKAPK